MSARSAFVFISALVLVRDADAFPVVKFAALYGVDLECSASSFLTSMVLPSGAAFAADAEACYDVEISKLESASTI